MSAAEREWVSLAGYIEILLKQGKRSQHEDFQALFRIYGKDRVTKIAKEILEREKEKRDVEAN